MTEISDDAVRPELAIELACSACLYVRPRPDLDEDEAAELKLLTVINGHMVCLRHASCARGGHHEVLMSAVFLESDDEKMGLDEYQKWRDAHDA